MIRSRRATPARDTPLGAEARTCRRVYVLYNTKATPHTSLRLGTMVMVVMLVTEVMKSCLGWKSGEYYARYSLPGYPMRNWSSVTRVWPVKLLSLCNSRKKRWKKDIKRERVKIMQPVYRLKTPLLLCTERCTRYP